MNETWKTNVGMSILGAVVGIVVNQLLTNMGMAGRVINAILMVLFIVYALVWYPSYFTDGPKLTNAGTISFLNLFAGGIIFGCLWNYNLTRHTKGVSNVVFVVFAVISILAFFFVLPYVTLTLG
ncbi:hypothetical protein [Olsenella profusa]|uniref:Uncharacterized protein n=1 Tax=Olsenella profusa F0195 TaxID=1125712 RepID=U2TMU7_9ACTN|nr:hypothetical protein [Olsenella profusa]ERL07488.1 hypothetical protein HMPREF1316_2305 [Olsenella profusa F0195]